LLSEQKICFVGAGSMAEAIIAGIREKNLIPAENITVVNRSNEQKIEKLVNKYGIVSIKDKMKAVSEANILLLGMKPKDVEEALKGIREYIHSQQIIISVIAGISSERIEEICEINVPVVRTMPNTSAMIGLSATGISKGQFASELHLHITQLIMGGIGSVAVVKEEDLDVVTGLSGSGPAYIYYLVEAMEKAATELGLEQNVARELTIQTIIGAGHMLRESNEEPNILREKVTSPGGTTMAGLQALKDFNFEEAIYQAVKNASERAKELGK